MGPKAKMKHLHLSKMDPKMGRQAKMGRIESRIVLFKEPKIQEICLSPKIKTVTLMMSAMSGTDIGVNGSTSGSQTFSDPKLDPKIVLEICLGPKLDPKIVLEICLGP